MLGERLSVITTALLAILLSEVGHAADKFTFDRAHTQVLFFVSHLGFSQSQGEFHDYDGGFTFDSNDWTNSRVEATIRTASLDMDDYAWDKHLRSEDFFDVNQYPTMTFRSTNVERIDGQRGLITGDLTLLGVTKPVVLEVTFNKAGIHPISKTYVAGFSASAILKRSEFGMKYGLPMVGDDVHVRLEVEGHRVEQ